MDEVVDLLSKTKVKDTIECNICKKQITRSVIARHQRSKACTLIRLEAQVEVWEDVIELEKKRFAEKLEEMLAKKRNIEQELQGLKAPRRKNQH